MRMGLGMNLPRIMPHPGKDLHRKEILHPGKFYQAIQFVSPWAAHLAAHVLRFEKSLGRRLVPGFCRADFR